MNILGIHDGHTATACWLEDGVIQYALSEERLTRKKGDGGFPVRAVQYLMERMGNRTVDRVALVGMISPLVSTDQYASGRQKLFPTIAKFFPGDPRWLIRKVRSWSETKRLASKELQSALEKCKLNGLPIDVVEHHQSHAAAAYYLSPFPQSGKATLVVTLDGSGDGLAGTVSRVEPDGTWKRLTEISTFDSLGVVYSRTTQFLAMRPWEHEYKLMGMAPYASPSRAAAVAEILKRYIRLSDDGLGFRNPSRYWGNSILGNMYDALKGHRFDSVAAGVQLLHEELSVGLVRNWLEKEGLDQLAVGGGCFMNIKANRLLLEIPRCKQLFVMPSGADESCPIGAALQSYSMLGSEQRANIQPLDHLYWGPEFGEQEIRTALKEVSDKVEFRKSDAIESESADLLAQHKILGRLSGRMEWGQRSLGNRSIIANPSRLENLRTLNAAVKMRDFWMPFAPSILWERRKDYAIDPHESHAYHMTLGFESTELARKDMIAALHPYDFTMRPQFVKREHNPKYHQLITEFERKTKVGAVLNTSFNLHGYPIVCSPADALRTLLNSAIDFVTLNDFLVWKRATG